MSISVRDDDGRTKRQITAASKSNIKRINLKTNRKTTIKKKSRKQKSEEKLHGYFKWQTEEMAQEMTWIGLSKGNLKRETDSEDNVLRIN